MNNAQRPLNQLGFFCFATIFLLAFQHSFSQAGSWDSSFNGTGRLNINENFMNLSTLASQQDGKILIAGGYNDVILSRYNLDGLPDNSFGFSGTTTANFGLPGYTESANLIHVLPEGKILMLGVEHGFNGHADTSIYFMGRFFSNGKTDSSFGQFGRVILNFTPNQTFKKMAIQKDGKIILAGHENLSDFYTSDPSLLCRLNADGSNDSSFGDAGIVRTIFNRHVNDSLAALFYTDRFSLNDILLLNNGKMIAAGAVSSSTNGFGYDSIGIVKYNADGSPDSTFNEDGKMTLNPPGRQEYDNGSFAGSMCLQPDGKILLGVNFLYRRIHGSFTLADLGVLRLNEDLSPDASFGENGIRIIEAEQKDNSLIKIALQSDGKIVLSANSRDINNFSSNFTLLRINSNGTDDSTFGTGGTVIPLFPYVNDFPVGTAYAMEMNGQRIYISGSGTYAGIFAFKNDGVSLNILNKHLCSSVSNISIAADLTGKNYQWQLSTDSVHFNNISNNNYYSGVTTASLSLNNISSSFNGYQYRCVTETSISNTTTLTVLKLNQYEWTGTVSNEWENPANWLCGEVPGQDATVIINSGNIIIHSNVSIGNLQLQPGTLLTVAAGYTLTIAH